MDVDIGSADRPLRRPLAGRLLAELRNDVNLTQKDVASAIGVRVQTVSDWETGVQGFNRTKIANLGILQDLLGPRATQLLGATRADDILADLLHNPKRAATDLSSALRSAVLRQLVFAFAQDDDAETAIFYPGERLTALHHLADLVTDSTSCFLPDEAGRQRSAILRNQGYYLFARGEHEDAFFLLRDIVSSEYDPVGLRGTAVSQAIARNPNPLNQRYLPQLREDEDTQQLNVEYSGFWSDERRIHPTLAYAAVEYWKGDQTYRWLVQHLRREPVLNGLDILIITYLLRQKGAVIAERNRSATQTLMHHLAAVERRHDLTAATKRDANDLLHTLNASS